jgi:hypothetical protein
VGIVIFDSRADIGTGQGVYLTAVAEAVPRDGIEHAGGGVRVAVDGDVPLPPRAAVGAQMTNCPQRVETPLTHAGTTTPTGSPTRAEL